MLGTIYQVTNNLDKTIAVVALALFVPLEALAGNQAPYYHPRGFMDQYWLLIPLKIEVVTNIGY